MSHVQNDTRKIVESKDITEGIVRMMVIDLRPFDTVEDVDFNQLFKLIFNSFPNPNSFGNPDSLENPDKFENLKFSDIRPDPEKISYSQPDPIFLAHLFKNTVIFINIY